MSGKRKQLIELNYPKRKVPESRGKTRSVPNTFFTFQRCRLLLPRLRQHFDLQRAGR
jgi:hypothetical protein